METKKSYVYHMQLKRYAFFESQNLENGQFDVTFDIGGKKLYAHNSMLNLVSDTFKAMLSDRWTSKNGVIKIEGYTYDDFKQFLTFIYSGECKFTPENIYAMVDMAEFYNVDTFKEACDEYLSKMEYNLENIFQFIDLADKYSMVKLGGLLKRFIKANFSKLVNSDEFLNVENSAVEKLVTLYPVTSEEDFQAIYEWAEKKAKEKSSNAINLNDVIKNELSEILPFIKFEQMPLDFLNDFVSERGFIFSSLIELKFILSKASRQLNFKVTNDSGQSLIGSVPYDSYLYEVIKSLKDVKSKS
jgi:hypothetical protein